MNTQTDAKVFTLWWRKNKRDAWSRIASASSEAELTQKLMTLPSGESVVTDGRHPDELRKARR